jgi:hypothetical protein
LRSEADPDGAEVVIGEVRDIIVKSDKIELEIHFTVVKCVFRVD